MHRLEMVLTQSIDLQVCHKSESQGSQNDKSDRHIERRIAEREREGGGQRMELPKLGQFSSPSSSPPAGRSPKSIGRKGSIRQRSGTLNSPL